MESIPHILARGSIVPKYDRVDIRERLFHHYRIIYRLIGEDVQVVSVCHGARLTRMPMVRSYVSEMAGKPRGRASTSTRSSPWARPSRRPWRSARPRATTRSTGFTLAGARRVHRRDVAQPGHGRRQPRRLGAMSTTS